MVETILKRFEIYGEDLNVVEKLFDGEVEQLRSLGFTVEPLRRLPTDPDLDYNFYRIHKESSNV